MNSISDTSPLQAAITEACFSAKQLKTIMERDAEVLIETPEDPPTAFTEAKEKFLSCLDLILEKAKDNIQLLQTLETDRCYIELQTLISELRTAPLDALIEKKPDTTEYYYQRAGLLFNLGRYDEAKRDYLAVLSKDANHFGALNDLGILEMENGQPTAAKVLFAQAASCHPEQTMSHLNYADFLLLQCEYENAKNHYRCALDIDPTLSKAHQGLAHAFQGLGDEAEASVHREAGFRGQAAFTWPYRGTSTGLPLLVIGSAYGGNIPLNHILDKRTFQSTIIMAEYFDLSAPLPPHRLIINLIGDADLSKRGLDATEELIARCTSPIINHPALVRATGRQVNAQRLGALPNVKTPRMVLLSKSELLAPTVAKRLIDLGIGFPLLLRSPGFHTGQYFLRAETVSDLNQAASKLPGENLLVMQVLDARNPQGASHKFRVMFVDGVIYPLHLAISDQWKVHYFSADMAEQTEYRALEQAFLEDMPSLLGQKAISALQSIRQALGLDYGGIDFAIDNNGDVLVFEANATMLVPLPPSDDEKWAYRHAATARILQAVRNMILKRANADNSVLEI